MGLLISDLVVKICKDIKALPYIYDCDIYGEEINTLDVMDKISIKVKGKQAQCLLDFAIIGTVDGCSNSSEMSVEAIFSLAVFAKKDNTTDSMGFSTVGMDVAQKLAGFLHKNKFGFTSEISSHPKIEQFISVGDSVKEKSHYQVWNITWTQKIKLKTN